MNAGCHSQVTCSLHTGKPLDCRAWHKMNAVIAAVQDDFDEFDCVAQGMSACDDCPDWTISSDGTKWTPEAEKNEGAWMEGPGAE
jgi:hypothetical protein